MIKNQFKTLSDPIWNRNQHLKPIRSGSTCWTTLQHVWVPMWPFVSVWLSKLEINYFNSLAIFLFAILFHSYQSISLRMYGIILVWDWPRPLDSRMLVQYRVSHNVWDWCWEFSNRPEIWQVDCRTASQISRRYGYLNIQSRGFQTWWDLAIRRRIKRCASFSLMPLFLIYTSTPWVFFQQAHDDVIKWKHFPRYWPFVRGIHRSPVNSPHKGQWRGDLVFSLICAE